MLDDVKILQSQKVKEIISVLNNKDNIVFKAPTGSGKTYMMADLMEQILNKDSNVIFLVVSLSKSDLAKQNAEKFEEYIANKKFKKINPYLISSETSGESGLYIPEDYNVYVLPRDLYKDNSKLDRGPFIHFLDTMTNTLPLGQNKKIYLIKDESHIATNNLDKLKNYFTKIINFSATPKFKKKTDSPDVELTESEAIEAKLIKNVEYKHESDTLEDALYAFKEIKKEYQDAQW